MNSVAPRMDSVHDASNGETRVEDVNCCNVSGTALHLHYEVRRSNCGEVVQIKVEKETGSCVYVIHCIATAFLVYSVWKTLGGGSVVWAVAGVFVLLLSLAQLVLTVTSETILVVSGIGMQVTQTFWIGMESSRFFACSDVRDVVINEAITMHRTLFYLVAIVGLGTEILVPLFVNTRPRLQQLQLIRGMIREVLTPTLQECGK